MYEVCYLLIPEKPLHTSSKVISIVFYPELAGPVFPDNIMWNFVSVMNGLSFYSTHAAQLDFIVPRVPLGL